MVDDNAKTANQAWRKKPRKFAPKSRLGCRTCKIRRVKCDLARPSCLKCQSTGRTCDGYGEMHVHETAKGTATCDQTSASSILLQASTLQGPGPLMCLPAAELTDMMAMAFFERVSIDQLDEYQPCDPWRKTLMLFSQTVPSVRCAATALALMHRDYLDGGCGEDLTSRTPDETPWFHYNRAIGLLLKENGGDSVETKAITLLVCYLFICFDHLTGNDTQAAKHLRGGVGISRNLDKAMRMGNNETGGGAALPGLRELISQVTRRISRLDNQAATFLVDWEPDDLQDSRISSPLPLVGGGAFRSLGEAFEHLQTLAARVMRLRWMDQQQVIPTLEVGPTPRPPKDSIREQLRKWSSLFENTLQQGLGYSARYLTADGPLESLVRLQFTVAWILLESYGPGRELEYDAFLPQFQQCVALAGDVHANYYTGTTRPTFKPEIGILPVLYIIGVKCRHPMVRREVLNILRRKAIREAVWDSRSVVRIVERVIEIEESSCAEGQRVFPSMAQIPIARRIEALSFVHVVSGTSVAQIDLHYTFCAREGLHTESLVI